MSAIIESNCSYCHKPYRHYQSKNRKYCSSECCTLGRRKRVWRKCASCGKNYETTSKRSLRYCSKSCATNGQVGRVRPELRDRAGWSAGLTKETDGRIAKMSERMTIAPPSRKTLYQFYTIDNLSYKAIGKMFGVAPGTCKRWVSNYGLLRKRELLTEDVLRELTEAEYTHVQIGEMYNCTNSFVSKLAKKYGIEAKHLVKSLDPDPEYLEHLYWERQMSYEEIGDIMGVHPTTIGNWFGRLGIKCRDSTLFGRPFLAKDGHKVRSGLELQVDNWLWDHCLEHEYEPTIPGTQYWSDFLVGDTYIEVWGMTGNPAYDKKRKKKIAAYHAANLNLLSIYPSDFPHLDTLSILLPK